MRMLPQNKNRVPEQSPFDFDLKRKKGKSQGMTLLLDGSHHQQYTDPVLGLGCNVGFKENKVTV